MLVGMPEWALSQYEVEVWCDEDKDAKHDHILKGGGGGGGGDGDGGDGRVFGGSLGWCPNYYTCGTHHGDQPEVAVHHRQ